MVAVVYKTKIGETKSYNEAKTNGNEIIATVYKTIEEEYIKTANEMLIKARRKAQGRG